MDESALIGYARKGDLDAFNRLVLAYQDMAYAVAYRVLGDADLAADATQNAFISAYRGLRGFRGGSFRAWLMRIVTNACYDELRRKQRRPSVPLEPLGSEGEEIDSPAWMEDPAEGPEEALMRAELAQAIERCLEQLEVEFRSVIVMVDVQGLNYAEASEALGTPLGTIKSRLARARLRVQDCLQGFQELLPSVFRLEGESSL